MRLPDKEGVAGKAWNVNTAENLIKRPDFQGSIAAYLVHAPQAHPFWSYYFIGVVHLRDIPNTPPPNKHFSDAEYEFSIWSIDPEALPDLETPHFKLLTPPDLLLQIERFNKDDNFAGSICEKMVDMIIEGRMSPDSDFRSAWEQFICSKFTS
jgi:hypothetical protein